ncbi:hypothetical protein WJX77_011778 [Trebouxia sp. C0004]
MAAWVESEDYHVSHGDTMPSICQSRVSEPSTIGFEDPEQDDGFWRCSFLFFLVLGRMMCTYQLQSTPLLQALCLCMLVADGGPAHHW